MMESFFFFAFIALSDQIFFLDTREQKVSKARKKSSDKKVSGEFLIKALSPSAFVSNVLDIFWKAWTFSTLFFRRLFYLFFIDERKGLIMNRRTKRIFH